MIASAGTRGASRRPPALARRLAAFVYEGVLLFGVLMISGYLYSSLTQQRHALQGKTGLQAFLFVVLGIYFGWFWSRSGQTLAMKTWHLRLVCADGSPLTQGRALVRYVLAWLWFLPALAVAYLMHAPTSGQIFGIMTIGVLSYGALSRWLPERQFLHDLLCGTRVVSTQAAADEAAQSGK